MNRTRILLAVLIVVGVVAGGNFYLQWSQKEKAAQTDVSVKNYRQQVLEAQDKLVSQARDWLDESSGQDELLKKAAGNLHRVLGVNPKNVEARIEMARFHLKSGHIDFRNFRQGTLGNAERELQRALDVQPDSADAYILLGHVHFLGYRPKEALEALEKAEAIGTSNPWLHLNWADALMDLKRWAEAESRAQMALPQHGAMVAPPKRVVRNAHQKLVDIYVKQRKLDAADKEYQALIALDPGEAFWHGNYAHFLLCIRGQPDAAIGEAEKALEIMDYGQAQYVLAAARYAKWAELKRKAPDQAARYLALAQASAPDFSYIMTQAGKWVSTGPVIEDMVRELMALGVSLDTKDNLGDTALTLAADLENLESVIILVKLGANIETKDRSGLTALGIAANKGNVEMVKALAARGAKVNTLDQNGRTPLFSAAHNGDVEMLRTLIALKTDGSITMANGFSPLMYAAYAGHEGAVRVLLQAGADPSSRTTDSKQSAADFAASRGHQKLAAYLQEAAEKGRVSSR